MVYNFNIIINNFKIILKTFTISYYVLILVFTRNDTFLFVNNKATPSKYIILFFSFEIIWYFKDLSKYRKYYIR